MLISVSHTTKQTVKVLRKTNAAINTY